MRVPGPKPAITEEVAEYVVQALYAILPDGLDDIIEILTGIPDGDEDDLGTWARGLLTGESDLDAGKLVGLIASSLIPGLDASKIISGALDALRIPGLDASKLVSGALNVLRIPDLDAGKIVSGALNALRIPSLDASKIGSGTFLTSLIPSLDAGKIVSGLLGAARIPDLDASKLTSGTVGAAQIPGLDASKITSGTLLAALIPGLDASKITSGSFPLSMVAGLVAELAGKAAATTLQNTLDAIWNGFGGSGSGSTSNVSTVISNYQNRITALEGVGVRTQYTSNFTWTNPYPTEHRKIGVLCINAGQNGATRTTTATSPGIGGGYSYAEFYTDQLPSTVACTIGASNGAVTSFGSYHRGYNGLGGIIEGEGKVVATSGAPGDGGLANYSSGAADAGGSSAFAIGGAGQVGGTAANGGAAPTGLPSGGGGGGGYAGNNSTNGGNGGFPGGGGGAKSGSGGSSGTGAAGTMFITNFWT